MLLDIRPDHLELVKTILQRWVPGLEVWVFGSRAKWTAKDNSDLDLCIVTSQPLSFEVMGHLQEAFSDSDLPYKVDVVDWSSVSKAFQAVIERDKVVMVQSSSANGQSRRGVSSEWRSGTLGEFVRLQRGHDLTASGQQPGTVPVMGSAGPNGTHNEALASGPGVVVGRSGASAGRVHFSKVDYWPHNTCLYVTDFLDNNPRFAYYLLQTLDLAAFNSGSAQPSLNRNFLYSIPLKIPQRVQQDGIVEVLQSLDDRITLLRETNATLEAIAQALFKSWFVDFDPVRAKMEGRAPGGMDEATAALFPDGFEESALGLVPRGWRVMPVGETVKTVGGATPDTKNPIFWELGVHCWTTPKDLSGIPAPVLLDTERKLSAQGLSKIGSGLLPTGALLLSSRAPIGYLALAQVPMAINQGYIAMLPGGLLPPLYMLFWCQQNMDNIKGRANGSTFMEISKKAFRPIPALVPSSQLVQVFSNTVGALFSRLVENEKQAQTLATLRDTLLPRLISGQLRLPIADAKPKTLELAA